MSDDEAWRYRKAQQLGLTDTRPVTPATPAGPAADVRGPAPVTPPVPRPSPVARPPAAPPIRPQPAAASPMTTGSGRLTRIGGAAAALVLAATAGWGLHSAIGPRLAPADLPMPVQAPVPAPAPAPTTAPEVAAPAVPAAEIALPAAVIEPRPQVIARAPEPAAAEPPAPARPRPVKAAPITGPSFNCRYASTDAQQMICASPTLARLDGAVAAAYRVAVERGGAAAERRLDREQAAFLNARGACRTPACITRLATRRLKRLERY
ncbi:hypothetical protein [Polymorphobacter fuscus]|uniref:Lysozyme inhibitor LprI N-terminal domain-containing protein n=1 Tax=Sandarakinorhabdus fusca TaxID=1439888 RepID=A0A7C9GNV9_9SPHN|nr:hypothetical protein [Polymorphobacter fuscus]KAB7647739.1 hypothetical protein F9290_07155 [Polymorphobacter fuscus]MQT17035.1 hypothetical protein [Polymorphobacter fuscus]NJC08973.1 hypothetical protein [Polymorphobacter fuscus]